MKRYAYDINLDAQDAPAKILRYIGTGKRVLEIGCASGTQTRIMKQQLNCHVVGVELDPDAANEARPFCDSLHVGDIETLDLQFQLESAPFDVVVFADVLEHLKDPRQA